MAFEIALERELDASVEAVWPLLTDPARMNEWATAEQVKALEQDVSDSLVLEHAWPTAEIAARVMRARLGLLDTSAIDWDSAAKVAEGPSHAEIAMACEQAAKNAIFDRLHLGSLLSAGPRPRGTSQHPRTHRQSPGSPGMSPAAIPAWTADGVLPPINASQPVSPERSPYVVSLTDCVLRFGA